MHIGALNLSRAGEQGHGGVGHMAKGVLERMQNWKERAFTIGVEGDDLYGPLGAPSLIGWRLH